MEWLSHLASFFAGLVAGYAIKVVISSKTTNSASASLVSQRGNSAGGDIVAGNSSKTNITSKS